MPSGKTHDRITLLLLAPTFIAVWSVTGSLTLASLVTSATFFGGWMFGPDLDTQSSQYKRWGVFRFLWLPYRVIFKHRSPWSHGILFGTLIRALYFSGIAALLVIAAVCLRAALIEGGVPNLYAVVESSLTLQAQVTQHIDKNAVWAIFAGLWWGAALHTIIDITWAILRKAFEIF